MYKLYYWFQPIETIVFSILFLKNRTLGKNLSNFLEHLSDFVL